MGYLGPVRAGSLAYQRGNIPSALLHGGKLPFPQLGCFLLYPDKICPHLICKQAETWSWGPVLLSLGDKSLQCDLSWSHGVSAPAQRFLVQKCRPILHLRDRMDGVTPEEFLLLREQIRRGRSMWRSELSAGIPDQCWQTLQECCKLLNSFGFALPTCSSKVCVSDTWRAETVALRDNKVSLLLPLNALSSSLLPIPAAFSTGRGWRQHFQGWG